MTNNGWDENHWEYRFEHGEIHPSFWKTIVISDEWKAWEEEQIKRIHTDSHEGCFDIDESRECNAFSPEHWKEFVKFLKNS